MRPRPMPAGFGATPVAKGVESGRRRRLSMGRGIETMRVFGIRKSQSLIREP